MKGNRSMQDMTEGRPISLILKFFFPLLFGMLFQQFYNLVDTAIVGKFLGPDDLAAVGATGSVNFLILGFCMGVCNGFSIPVAQKFGAKDESGLRRFVANSVWLSVIFAAVMTVVVCFLCRQILIWMDTPANILEGVERGVDFFDCVYPTRNGRHGHVYTNQGKINLFNQKYEKDMRPIEEGCGCPPCRRYSRAYVRHLLKAKEMLGMRLCVLHNLYFYNTMMEEIRDAIDEGRFHSYKEEKLYGMGQINREKEKQNG